MAKTTTNTTTQTYTKARIDVINDHFELFLRCAGMGDDTVDKFLLSVEKHEIDEVGVYILQDEFRVAEVSFKVNWNKHIELVRVNGDIFDTEEPGWNKGVSPEAYVAVGRLVKEAKRLNTKVYSWILVADFIRSSENEHKRVCDELGYSFDSKVPSWKKEPVEDVRQIEGLSEARVIRRQIVE